MVFSHPKYNTYALIVVLFLGVFIGLAYFMRANTQWKTYTNSFDHFQLRIPSDWQVIHSTLPNGYAQDELQSKNNEIHIFCPVKLPDTVVRTQQQFHLPKVQLGKYTVPRDRYIRVDSVIVDYINLMNIPHQHDISCSFDIQGDFEKNNAIVLDILKTFQYTQKEKDLSDYVMYTLPAGWKKDSQTFDYLTVRSPDYAQSLHVGYITAGVSITVSRKIMPPNKTLNAIADESPQMNKEPLQTIVIDGVQAVTRHSDWESHALVYYLQKNGYLWEIWAATANLTDEYNHKHEIDAFITSLHFVENATYINSLQEHQWKVSYIQKKITDVTEDIHIINTTTGEDRVIGQTYVVKHGESAIFTKDTDEIIFLAPEKIVWYSISQNKITNTISLSDIKKALPSLQIPRNASLESLALSPEGDKIALSYGYTYEMDSHADIILVNLINRNISTVNAKGVVKDWKDNTTLEYFTTPTTVKEITIQ